LDQVKFWVKVKLCVKVMSKVTVVVNFNVHLASPEDSPEGAAGASTGLIR